MVSRWFTVLRYALGCVPYRGKNGVMKVIENKGAFMSNKNIPLTALKGVGDTRKKALTRLKIETLTDLISYFPRTYDDRRNVQKINELTVGEYALVSGLVLTSPRVQRIRQGREIIKFSIADGSARMELAFFNQSYRKDQIKQGESYFFYGKVTGTERLPSLTNPVIELEEKAGTHTGRILPLYRLTQGISQNFLQSIVREALLLYKNEFPCFIPPAICAEYDLAKTAFSYHNIHFPEDDTALWQARKRLIFEELFLFATALHFMKNRRRTHFGQSIAPCDMQPFYQALTFAPTGAQRRAIDEALVDMQSEKPMNRLLQGDVGSGKTACAAALAYASFCGGFQTAFMVPTEILAQQHYESLSKILAPLGIQIGLFTGSLKAKEKREILAQIKNGDYQLVVGTHALISQNVAYHNLGLVITDEQHRFGVDQRAALSQKGAHPHVFIMSATPIPRTLALILYGDLDVSVLDEMPPGRQVIDTYAVDENYRLRIFDFTRRLLNEGRQAFFVCPAIEVDPDDVSGGQKSVEAYAKDLKENIFPDKRVAFLHGKQKPKEKEAIMAAFAAGETDILVSTTVIEVGVDVPNAALMVVENAEHFGLSQLHQLRGRVGRGKHKSYCVLFSNSQNETTKARLSVMTKTNNGFEIAEEDLSLRGPGDFFGNRQHGLPQMKLANLSYNMDLLKEAQAAATKLIEDDPKLEKPEHAALCAQIKHLYELSSERLQ